MPSNHGGHRKGAGRKGYGEPTKMMRVPESYVSMVRNLLADTVKLRESSQDTLLVIPPSDVPTVLKRPLFGSSVSAGYPSPADDYIEDQLDLNEYFIHNPASTFFVRVTGESMKDAGILPNDILVVDRSLNAKHGSIVIAVVNTELTVKRLHKQDGKIELHPENSEFSAIKFSSGMELEIWGVVSGVTRKL